MLKARLVILLLALVPGLVSAGIPLTTLAELNAQGTPTLAPMLERVTPAVVNISTRGRVVENRNLNPLLSDPFFRRFFNLPAQPRERQTQSLGSGVVVDAENGYVLTNNHVIDKAEEITVTLRDRRKLKAKVIGVDADTDVAVIQVPAEGLNALPMANSSSLRVGDFVVAIGNPFGLGQTVTSGIVSALGRSGLGIEGYEDFIQTDASINPGNSGGALVNLKGELVGINTAILSPGGGGNVGIGFAIPINMVGDIMQQLIQYGEVKRGRLGVSMQDMTESLAEAFGMQHIEGAVVSQIAPGSAADKAGLREGDVVIEVNGRKVRSAADLRNVIGLLRAGQKVDLVVVRNGKRRSVRAEVEPIKEISVSGRKISRLLDGSILSMIEGFDDASDVEGVRVAEVKRGSNAWRAGLRKDDVIMSANRILVRNFDELKQAISRSRRGLLLNVQRGDEALFLLIQ